MGRKRFFGGPFSRGSFRRWLFSGRLGWWPRREISAFLQRRLMLQYWRRTRRRIQRRRSAQASSSSSSQLLPAADLHQIHSHSASSSSSSTTAPLPPVLRAFPFIGPHAPVLRVQINIVRVGLPIGIPVLAPEAPDDDHDYDAEDYDYDASDESTTAPGHV